MDGDGTAYQGLSVCDVTTYVTGLRNSYDFAWHSNGEMYATDNALGVAGAVPASFTPDCQGINDDPADDPGTQNELLVRVVAGKYYGHPNPARDECIFKDGTFQSAPAPDPDYELPIYSVWVSTSSNAIREYVSPACPALQGQLLVSQFSTTNQIVRLTLNGAGDQVTSELVLKSGLDDPLPLALAPDGTIFVGEYDQMSLANGFVTVLASDTNSQGCNG